MFTLMHWKVGCIIHKLSSFCGTWLFTTICSIWKMVSTIVIAAYENSRTVTFILTVSLTYITLVQLRATCLGACVVFTAGIRFSTTIGPFREIFATGSTHQVANTLVIICTRTLIISTYVCAINFIAAWISVIDNFIQIINGFRKIL